MALLASTATTTTSFTSSPPSNVPAPIPACLAPGGQFSFSPAVCPQGWPAWWLGQTTTSAGLSGAAVTAPSAAAGSSVAYYVSTAYCCAPNYSMPHQGIQADPSPSCEQAFVSTTSSSGDSFVSTATLSVAMLPAWHISWQTTDMPTLSTRPPALNGNERITRWVPGSKPEREPQDNWGGGGGISRGLFFFLVIGIPLLVVALIAASLIGCRARVAKTWSRRSSSSGGGGVPKRSDSTTTAS